MYNSDPVKEFTKNRVYEPRLTPYQKQKLKSPAQKLSTMFFEMNEKPSLKSSKRSLNSCKRMSPKQFLLPPMEILHSRLIHDGFRFGRSHFFIELTRIYMYIYTCISKYLTLIRISLFSFLLEKEQKWCNHSGIANSNSFSLIGVESKAQVAWFLLRLQLMWPPEICIARCV